MLKYKIVVHYRTLRLGTKIKRCWLSMDRLLYIAYKPSTGALNLR